MPHSGLILDRDINASLNIAKRGWVALFSHDSQAHEARKQLKDVEPTAWKLSYHQKLNRTRRRVANIAELRE